MMNKVCQISPNLIKRARDVTTVMNSQENHGKHTNHHALLAPFSPREWNEPDRIYMDGFIIEVLKPTKKGKLELHSFALGGQIAGSGDVWSLI